LDEDVISRSRGIQDRVSSPSMSGVLLDATIGEGDALNVFAGPFGVASDPRLG